ncbi:Gfo/Idh/MocA family oxidoreductase [Saccharopolyspora griseoalba]|uniref:Gfo/Idh/MocA family oxidoreductase n=1 Tax=Saccharopolyspora griseoalba TaxID=1431848 RepID=A0ABW2LK69_9PSEU
MLRPFVIGLGHAGADLHLRVLARARARAGELFAPGPVIGCDPDPSRHRPEITSCTSIDAATATLDPRRAVAHLCTPPEGRAALLAELAERGFRSIVVEKPLATGLDELAEVDELRARHGLNLVVVSHWLDSRLTDRLAERVGRGIPRSISFDQDKPRFTRSAASADHPTAFDVEIPHSLAVVLRLAGPARVVGAECSDMHLPGTALAGMGGARLSLEHDCGARSEIRSDLTAPHRRRRIEIGLDGGSVVGHYPVGADDDHAQLETAGSREVFSDDALTRFVLRAYRHFHRPNAEHGTFELHREIVRLLATAKERTLAHAR